MQVAEDFPPTFVSLSVFSDDPQFNTEPTEGNNLLPLSSGIIATQIIQSAIGIMLSISSQIAIKKRTPIVLRHMTGMTILALILFDILVILQFYLCDLYLFKVIAADFPSENH